MSLQRRRVKRNLPRTGHTYTTPTREYPESAPFSRPNSVNSDESDSMGQPVHQHSYSPAPPPRPPSARGGRRRAPHVRPPSREGTSYSLYEGSEYNRRTDEYSMDAFSRVSPSPLSRPSSSLSKYTPLPPIGQHHASFEGDIGETGDLTHSLGKLAITSHESSPEATNQNRSHHTERDDTKRLQHGAKNARPSSKTYFSAGTRNSESHSVNRDKNITNKGKFEEQNSENHKRKDASPRKPGDGQPSCITLALKLPDGQRFQHNFFTSSSLRSVLKYAETESGKSFDGYSLIQNSPKKVFSDLSRTLLECSLEDRTLLYLDMDD